MEEVASLRPKSHRRKNGFEIGLIALIVLLVEVFICNYQFYSSPGTELDYDSTSFTTSGLTLYGEEGDVYETFTSFPSITLSSVNTKVYTVCLDAQYYSDYPSVLTAKVYSCDASTGKTIAATDELSVSKTSTLSQYVSVSFNDSSSSITISFVDVKINSLIEIKSAALNKRRPFVFSFIRVGIMLGISYLVFFLTYLFRYREEIRDNFSFKKCLRWLFRLLPLGIVTFFFWLYGNFASPFLVSSGSEMSQEMVDSILAGKLWLLATPSSDLLALSNPYDPLARSGVTFLWDHLLYQGHYYSYYGLTPVWLFFLPLHIIFKDWYVYDAYGVFTFTLVGAFFLSFLYERLLKAIFPDKKIPLFLEIGGFLLLFFNSGLLTNVIRPYFYEAATSSAAMCLIIGLTHYAYSGLFDVKKSKIRFYHLLFGSVWVSLAVLARATMALYAVAAVIWIILYFIKNHPLFSKKEKGLYWLFAFIPFVIFGSFQCWYNAARFGSIFDFGIEYSLTVADFLHMDFHPAAVLTSLWNFLFTAPYLSSATTMLSSNFYTFPGTAFYYFETTASYGLFARVPLLFLIFAIPFIPIAKGFKERSIFFAKWIIPGFIVPLIIVGLTWQSGYATRYYSDFSWQMLFLALFVFYWIYLEKPADKTREKVLAVIFIASVIYGVIGETGLINFYIPEVTQHDGILDYSYNYRWYRWWREITFWR